MKCLAGPNESIAKSSSSIAVNNKHLASAPLTVLFYASDSAGWHDIATSDEVIFLDDEGNRVEML